MSELHDAVTAAVMGGEAGESGSDAGFQGEATSEGFEGTSEVTAPAEKQYLDFDEYADRYVKIGDDEVPVKDLPSGYMKAKDYTQKTQELAQKRQITAWAETLLGALQEDPSGTLDILRNTFGSEVEVQGQPEESDDPLARQVTDINRKLASWEQKEVRSQIEREVADLQSQYGEDFDVNEAVALAGELGIRLPHAQEILYGRKARSGGRAAADLAAKVEAKRADSVVSAGGGSRAVEPGLAQFDTPQDALRAALKAAGAI